MEHQIRAWVTAIIIGILIAIHHYYTQYKKTLKELDELKFYYETKYGEIKDLSDLINDKKRILQSILIDINVSNIKKEELSEELKKMKKKTIIKENL
jgi:hypothetical protein